VEISEAAVRNFYDQSRDIEHIDCVWDISSDDGKNVSAVGHMTSHVTDHMTHLVTNHVVIGQLVCFASCYGYNIPDH